MTSLSAVPFQVLQIGPGTGFGTAPKYPKMLADEDAMKVREELPKVRKRQGVPVPVATCSIAAFVSACFERSSLVLGFGCLAILFLERTRTEWERWISVESPIGDFRTKLQPGFFGREPETLDWRLSSKVVIPGDDQQRSLDVSITADVSGPSEMMIAPVAHVLERFKSVGLEVFDPVLDEMFYNCCLWFGVNEEDAKRLRSGETIDGREELNGLGPETILNSFDRLSPLELGTPESWDVYGMPPCECHLTLHKADYLISIHVGFLEGKAVGACMEYC